MCNENEDIDDKTNDYIFELLVCEERYELTKNVIHIFEAITIFKKTNLDYSKQNWIMGYINELSHRVVSASEEDSKDKRKLTAILGLSTGKDFSLYRKQKEIDFSIYKEIEMIYNDSEYKISKESLFHSLADSKKYKMNFETIRSIYYKYAKEAKEAKDAESK